jgi:uncharacterized protein (DUF2236 family)
MSAPHGDDVGEYRRYLMSGLSLALGGANVIMQLSRPSVGHGVAESTVESGSLYAHPVKRTRTTLGYIMIALFGTDHERDVIQNEVNRQHRSVRSSPESPVNYNAFDPELQLWVGACMYRGLEDAALFLYGDSSNEWLDSVYGHSARFATTLQVPVSMWPEHREAFEKYWSDALQHVAMDDTTRRFLYGIASLDFLPLALRVMFARPHRFMTTGFLPANFRDELGLEWSDRRQRAFTTMCAMLAQANRVLPRPAREFPWNVVLWDTRRRIRAGRPVV